MTDATPTPVDLATALAARSARRARWWPAWLLSLSVHALLVYSWPQPWSQNWTSEPQVQITLLDEAGLETASTTAPAATPERPNAPSPDQPRPDPVAPLAPHVVLSVNRQARSAPVQRTDLPLPARRLAPRWSAPLPMLAPTSSQSSQAAADLSLELERWLERRQNYPRAARRAGLQGEVRLRFLLSRGGQASGVRVVQSSGAAILDRAATDLLRDAGPLPWPEPLQAEAIEVEVPIRYTLNPLETPR